MPSDSLIIPSPSQCRLLIKAHCDLLIEQLQQALSTVHLVRQCTAEPSTPLNDCVNTLALIEDPLHCALETLERFNQSRHAD